MKVPSPSAAQKPIVRPACQEDLEGVLALFRQLNPGDPILDPEMARSTWIRLLSSGFTTMFVAEVDGLPAACCTLAIIPNLSRGARPYGVIENVVTDADHRRKGLGHAVLHAARDLAWQEGCYKLLLATGSKKESTLRFYKTAGFNTGNKTYFEMRNN
ncbi:GNAT family N-acetyltransferase [Roseibium litorale]|uniref:GNAT family N-acetyltransferase n=1 Tax=Roseibium litorale TaxID=2803841 RepID=A0ABR9CIT2_9HYPH|nr:GNAT family N-acetyltransferase [Roseibium litorale]MBD8890658.1 GNAT family N-acetyltransferase [Roseibium litorale]